MSLLPGVIPCGMWVPIVVSQPCELLYTCYLVTYGIGVSDTVNMQYVLFYCIAFSALMLLVGWQKGIRSVKKWVVGAGVVVCLEWGADLHIAQLMPLPLTVSCFSEIQIGFSFLVPAHLGSSGKRATEWTCVCVLYSVDDDFWALIFTFVQYFVFRAFYRVCCFCCMLLSCCLLA